MRKSIFLYMLLALIAVFVVILFWQPIRYSGVSQLCRLIQEGEEEEAIAQIKKMKNVNVFTAPWWIEPIFAFMDIQITTPLIEACLYGRTDVVEVLLNQGANPNMYLKGGWTPIEATFVHNGSEDRLLIAQMLVKHGADVTSYASGQSALFLELIRAMHRHDETAEEQLQTEACLSFLLEQGAEPTNERRQTLLHYLAGTSDTQLLQSFFDGYQQYIDIQDDLGMTPLMWAVNRGQLENVQFLIEQGADITKTNAEGKTAYDCAVENGYTDIAELLKLQ